MNQLIALELLLKLSIQKFNFRTYPYLFIVYYSCSEVHPRNLVPVILYKGLRSSRRTPAVLNNLCNLCC